jgi:hypothetical protein
MKKVLIAVATNRVEQVLSGDDKEFEVHPSLAWHTVADEKVAQGWRYNPADNTVKDIQAEWEATDEGKRAMMKSNRKLEYGLLSDQLDAIYRDLRDGTTKYVDHITAVKTKHPKVPAVDPNDKDTVTGE